MFLHRDAICIIIISAIAIHQYILILHNIKKNNPCSYGMNLYQTLGIIISLEFISTPLVKKMMIVLYGLILYFLFTYVYIYQLKYGKYHDIRYVQKNLIIICAVYLFFILITFVFHM